MKALYTFQSVRD